MLMIRKQIAAAIAGAAGLVVLGLAIALWTLSARLETRTAERDAARQETRTEVAKHAVTRGSLDTCLGVVDQKNAESERRAAELARIAAVDAAGIVAADARRAADADRRAALARLAQLPPVPGCAAPAALLDNLKGL